MIPNFKSSVNFAIFGISPVLFSPAKHSVILHNAADVAEMLRAKSAQPRALHAHLRENHAQARVNDALCCAYGAVHEKHNTGDSEYILSKSD